MRRHEGRVCGIRTDLDEQPTAVSEEHGVLGGVGGERGEVEMPGGGTERFAEYVAAVFGGEMRCDEVDY